MEKITAETTYRIMDAIAYAITIMCACEKPTDSEVDELSRAITTLYCHEEGIEPDYTGICSPVNFDEDPCEDCDDDCDNCCYNDDYDEDDEDEEIDDEFSSALETFVETFKKYLKGD